MSAIAEVVIGTVELLQAEARRLGSSAKSLAVALVIIFAAGALLLGGLGWLVAAAYLQLRVWLEPAPAAAILGLTNMVIAGGAIWYATNKR
jgi:hypothetical protein